MSASPHSHAASIPGLPCSQCKCCPAQEGFELCVFCEDGVACPNRKKQADHPSLPVHQDVIAALGAQGYKLRDAKLVVERLNKPCATFDNLFRAALAILSGAASLPPAASTSQRPANTVASPAEGAQDRAHSPTQGTVRTTVASAPSAPSSQPRKETPMAENKCRAPEFGIACGKTLGPTNNSGFCAAHFYYSKKDPKDYQPAPEPKRGRKAADAEKTPPQQTNGHAALPPVVIAGNGHANGREHTKVTCAVSELAMDRIWTKLTPEEKAQLLFPPETEPAQHA